MADFQQRILLSVETDAASAQADIDAVKKKLELINNVITDKSIKTLKQELKDSQVVVQRLFQELKKAEDELEELALTAGKSSKAFQEAEERVKTLKTAFDASAKGVATLKNDIDEVNISINGLNPDNKLAPIGQLAKAGALAVQGLAGAFTAIGVESDTAQVAIAKLQGIMAFTDAINALGDMKEVWKNLGAVIKGNTVLTTLNTAVNKAAAFSMKALGIAANTTSFSFQALKAAIISTGIGAIVVGIATLLPMISNWISGTDDAEAAQKRLNLALEAQQDLLNSELQSIDYVTKARIARAKIAGKTEAEIRGIENGAAEERIKALKDNSDRLDAIASDRKEMEERSVEDQQKINDESIKAYRDYLKALGDEDIRKLNQQADDAEKSRQKQKEAADKAANDRKQQRDRDLADLKQYRDQVDAINREALKQLAEHNLNEKGLELKRNKDVYDTNIAQITKARDFELKYAKKYGGDVQAVKDKYVEVSANLLKQQLQNEADIRAKFDKQIQDFIFTQTTNEFQQKRDAVIKEFDEMIKIAGEKASELEALKQSKLSQIDTEENLRKNTVTSQTNLIVTETETAPSDDDTPNQAKAKIDALQTARLEAEAAAFELKKEQLRGQKEELEQLEAEHNANIVNINKEASDAKKEIDAAELEAKRNAVQAGINLANQAADLLGKHTVAGKALAVAATTIDTFKSAQSAYTGMVKAIPGPVGIAAGVAAAAVSVAAGLANVKKILAVKVPAKGGTGGSTPSAPAISTAPVIQASQTSAANNAIQDVRVTNPQDQISRAYIVDRDLQSNQQKSEFLNNLKTI